MKGDDRDYFKSKIESLEFAKGSLESNVQTGILTPEKYLNGVKQYLKSVQKLLVQATTQLGKTNEHTKRLNKRVELLNIEIADMD